MGTKIVYMFHVKKAGLLIALCFIERQIKKQKIFLGKCLKKKELYKKGSIFCEKKSKETKLLILM